MDRNYYVYIVTNPNNTVFYTGVTNNLVRRLYEHKSKTIEGFTKKYNCVKLVWYEIYIDPENAIVREKQIKAGSRKKKKELISSFNTKWKDLYEEII